MALGPPDEWTTPAGYPDSLGLCVLDAIWSIGVHYSGVENVLAAYRVLRRSSGADPARDGAAELVLAVAATGGPAAFADRVGNHQRTSTRSGILKSEAVVLSAQALVDNSVHTTGDLRSAAAHKRGDIELAWRRTPGQRSGISWRYLRLLAGDQQVKPDRMIIAFVQLAIGRPSSADEAADLVTAAAPRLGVDVRTIDHRIWRKQSGRG